MSVSTTLLPDKATYGDLSQRDLYVRNKHQTTTSNVNNTFYYDDGSTRTLIGGEQVTYDSGTTEGALHLFSKPNSGALNTSLTSNIKKGVFESLKYPYFEPAVIKFDREDVREFASEDVSFCIHARVLLDGLERIRRRHHGLHQGLFVHALDRGRQFADGSAEASVESSTSESSQWMHRR